MKKIVILLFCLFILTACSNSKQEIIEEPINEEVEVIEPVKQEIKTSLIMGGDALTHESVYLDAKTDDGYDFTYLLSNIKEIVEPYDLAYYNQETVLGGTKYEITGYPVFNTPQEAGEGLIDAGFNLVSLASNHLLDYYNSLGNTLIVSQKEFFNEYNNVLTAGSYLSKKEKDELKIKEINGLTYALLSYTYGSNNAGPSDNESYLINYIDKELIQKDVELYRDKVDLLIVCMHWGEEGSLEENGYQREHAEFLASLGVDIVIGTHPHVLQPIEWIDNTLVIYSLGNLYSNQYFNVDNLSSCLLSLDIIKTIEGDISNIKIDNVRCDMIFTDLEDKHKVYLYRDLTDEQLENKEEYFNKYKEILTKYEKDIIVE